MRSRPPPTRDRATGEEKKQVKGEMQGMPVLGIAAGVAQVRLPPTPGWVTGGWRSAVTFVHTLPKGRLPGGQPRQSGVALADGRGEEVGLVPSGKLDGVLLGVGLVLGLGVTLAYTQSPLAGAIVAYTRPLAVHCWGAGAHTTTPPPTGMEICPLPQGVGAAIL
jgi:hypothetical protein